MRRLVLALTLVLAGRGLCDVVVLSNGMVIRGRILSETETSVILEGCPSPIPKSQVSQILRDYTDALDQYRERSEALSPDDVEGRLALIEFCLDNSLFAEARLELARLPRTPELQAQREVLSKRATALESLAESVRALEQGDYARAVSLGERAQASGLLTQEQAEQAAAVLATAKEALAQRERLEELAAVATAPGEPERPYEIHLFPGGRGVERLLRLVSGSEEEIFLAAPSLDLGVLIDALRRAARRGVSVTLVSDEFSPSCDSLREEGVVLLEPSGRGRMRHNFIIFDRRSVWLGTFEPTEFAAFNGRSVAILTEVPEVAENFASEAEELVRGEFGRDSTPGLPAPRFMLDGEGGALLMLPEDDGLGQMESLLKAANQSIRLLLSEPLDRGLLKALREAVDRGVKVFVVADERLRERWRTLRRLPGYGIEVRVETERQELSGGYALLDGSLVVLVSSGFDSPSLKDDDGFMLLLAGQGLADVLLDEFTALFRTGVEP